MTRRYGPGHFSEDPYSQILSPHGIRVDDLVAPVLIEVLHRNFEAAPGGDWLMACHAVRVLAGAHKDRTTAEHSDWAAAKVDCGEVLVQVPDYAHCVHTRAGQEQGRGLMQWWEHGAQVRDEAPGADHRYRDDLIKLHREDEADNGTEPPSSRWTRQTEH